MANQPTQANSARYIYTLHETLETVRKGEPYCKLRNSPHFYLTKEARSDEKIRFTENYMTSVVRTILFMHAFDTVPENPIDDILYKGVVWYADTAPTELVNPLHSLVECALILDTLLGEGFSTVCRRPLSEVYNRCWAKEWKYSDYYKQVQMPSALDYVRLIRLVNVTYASHTDCTMFATRNATDLNIKLQQNCKRL